MTDRYSQLRAEDKFRKEIAEAVGLGFDLPTSPAADCTGLGAEFAPNAPKIDSLELAVVP
jgi:hypothetical protein